MIEALWDGNDPLCSRKDLKNRIDVLKATVRKGDAFKQGRAKQLAPCKVFQPAVVQQQRQRLFRIPHPLRQHRTAQGDHRILHPVETDRDLCCIRLTRRHQAFHHVVLNVVIAVHKQVVITVGHAHRTVAGSALSLIFAVDTAHLRIACRITVRDRSAFIARAIVHDDDLCMRIRLCHQGIQAACHVRRCIVHRYDDADKFLFHFVTPLQRQGNCLSLPAHIPA